MLILKDFVYQVLALALQTYIALLIVYILTGWFVRNRSAAWFVFLQELAEPPLGWVRRLTGNRLVVSNIDFSPIVLFFGLQLLQKLLYLVFHS